MTSRALAQARRTNKMLETTKRLFDHIRGVQTNVEGFLRHVRSA
jgi:hypothetical protein